MYSTQILNVKTFEIPYFDEHRQQNSHLWGPRAVDQGPGPQRIPQLGEVQALILRFWNGERGPGTAGAPQQRPGDEARAGVGFRRGVSSLGLPRPSSLETETEPGLWGTRATPGSRGRLLLLRLTARMGAQPVPLSCTPPQLLGTGEQPTPGNKQREGSLLSPVQDVQEPLQV